jgi:hypothetical protein
VGAVTGRVVAVCRSPGHSFSKPVVETVDLVARLGVAGDCHAGATVQHRSRLVTEATKPNLRQVHLIHAELIETLKAQGFRVAPGAMGENITTFGVALLDLPRGTRLRLGAEAEVTITGLRTPCRQLDDFQAGLMEAVIDRTQRGARSFLVGVMAEASRSGRIRPGDAIEIVLPPKPHKPLGRV